MPALPYPMAELPAKPTHSSYDQYNYPRENTSRRQASQTTSWTSPHQKGDDRRARYSRTSYHQGGGSSSSLASTNTNITTSQPSPSSSATSTASSLRTPPDLLLNGSSLASSLSNPFSSHKGMNLLDGKGKSNLIEPVHLSLDQLESRLALLSGLSKEAITSDIPTPPCSPKLARKKMQESKKRNANYSSEESNEESQSREAKKMRQNNRTTTTTTTTTAAAAAAGGARLSGSTPNDDAASSSHQFGGPSSEAWIPPPSRKWTKELYFEVAKAYRQRGRELKHRGDQRRRDVSTNKRLSSSPEKEALVASLEQTDALLLYMYGFWCEDQACGGSCVVANWTSLYGLLKYVYVNHERSKMSLLAGLCRLLEALVLRHVANHEMRLMNHRLSKTLASAGAPSPASTKTTATTTTTAASPASSESIHQTLAEVNENMTRILADNERSSRLLQQAKQSILNLSSLREKYPAVASLCEKSMTSREWNAMDQSALASRIDPNADLDSSSSSTSLLVTNEGGWTWPLDFSTPFPFIVCFGRAILREAALEAKVQFTMEPVQLP